MRYGLLRNNGKSYPVVSEGTTVNAGMMELIRGNCSTSASRSPASSNPQPNDRPVRLRRQHSISRHLHIRMDQHHMEPAEEGDQVVLLDLVRHRCLARKMRLRVVWYPRDEI
jgi:hypothetical protein